MRCPRLRLLVPVVALLFAAACSGGSGGTGQGDRLHPKGGDVFLEPLAESGPNTFTQSVALAPVPSIPAAGATGGSSTQGLRSISGTTSGLYGGSGSQQACDPNTAVASLLDHDANAQAWVDALNTDADLTWSGGSKLAVEDITTYVGELTSVILRNDTRVTDHAFSSNRSPAFQAVLQHGTAVMVDPQGVPRVRCAAFSPLTPPVPASSPKYRGTKWDGFDPKKLVAVTSGRTVDSFAVIDIHTGKKIDIFVGANCLCDRTKQGSTTTSTTLDFVNETTTTSKTGRTTTTVRRSTTTTTPATTTTHVTTTTPPTTTPATTTPTTAAP